MEVIWEEDDPSTEQGSALYKLTGNIIWEIDQIVIGRRKLQRKSALVYHIVSGGNVEVIRRVFKRLKDEKRQRELSWLIGSYVEKQESLLSCSFWKVVLFIFLAVFFVVSTPVFYVLHAISTQWYTAHRTRIHKHVELPLVFALISEDPDMVKLFLENGCRISSQDKNGNNIYHYLADLSLDQPQKAMRCHEIIIDLVNDVSDLKRVIMFVENKEALTPWECMAKYGSLSLFKNISMDQCGMGSRILTVSEERLWAKLPAEHWTQVNNSSPNIMRKNILQEDHKNPAIIDVWEFDIERYDQGDIYGRHSFPLHIITSRCVEHLSEDDAESLMNFTLLWRWMSAKVKKYAAACVASHVFNVALTVVLLIFIIKHGGDMNASPLAAPAHADYIKELHSLSEIIAADNETISEQNTTLYNFASDTLMLNSCVLSNDKAGPLDAVRIFPPGADNCIISIVTAIQEKCNIFDAERVFNMSTTEHTREHSAPDFIIRTTIYCFIGTSIAIDLMSRMLFLFLNFNWRSKSFCGSIGMVLSRTLPGSYIEKQLSLTMFSLYFSAVYTGYLYRSSIHNMLEAYQTYKELLMQDDTMELRETFGLLGRALVELRHDIIFLEGLWGTLLVLCLLLRFLTLIHSMRLIPGVGFFVITATKMAKHLAQFAVIFAIVSLAFATVFYFVMKNPDCPAIKLEYFRSLGTSLFTIYQVFLGYGEYDFSANVNARLAYIAYTVTTVVLLLNLVIAVMTTTVEELNRSPWKDVCMMFEDWNEILGTEAAVLTLIRPFKYIIDKFKVIFDLTEDEAAKRKFEIVCWSRFDSMHTSPLN